MRRLSLVLVTLPLAAGCGAARYSTSPEYMSSGFYKDQAAMSAGSLFASDQAVMSNEAIDKVLTSKLTLPAQGRVAVLRFGPHSRWLWWSEELTKLGQETVSKFLGKLQACSRIADASLLPSLLTPGKQTVPYLREAAARYQADLLLVYRSASYTYEKQRFLAPDEAKANCFVEAVLLDVRTGVVPFTSVVTRTYTAKKSREDFNFTETVRKAELKALGQALDEVADDLVEFLEAVPGAEAAGDIIHP